MKIYPILAGLALAVVSPAFAQTTTPNPALSEVFNTDGASGTVLTSTFANQSKGVGFTPSNDNNAFFNVATSNGTAQTIYNPLILSNTITSGSSFQIGVHAFANNEAGSGPVTIFTSIFNFDPNAAAGNVPITGPAIINNAPIQITSSGTNTPQSDVVYFTGTVTLPQTLTAGSEYVIAFAPDATANSTADDFALVFGKPFSQSGQPSADQSVFQNEYFVDNNSSNTGGAYSQDLTTGNPASPIAYRFYAGASTAAPEPSTTAAFIWGGLAIGLLVWKRRRTS